MQEALVGRRVRRQCDASVDSSLLHVEQQVAAAKVGQSGDSTMPASAIQSNGPVSINIVITAC